MAGCVSASWIAIAPDFRCCSTWCTEHDYILHHCLTTWIHNMTCAWILHNCIWSHLAVGHALAMHKRALTVETGQPFNPDQVWSKYQAKCRQNWGRVRKISLKHMSTNLHVTARPSSGPHSFARWSGPSLERSWATPADGAEAMMSDAGVWSQVFVHQSSYEPSDHWSGHGMSWCAESWDQGPQDHFTRDHMI